MVEVVSCVGMGLGVGGADNRGDGVVNNGGNVSVAGGGARLRDCCRFPDGILGEFWKELPYRLPFAFNIDDVFLDKPGRKRWLR